VALPLAQFVTVWAFLAVNIASPGPNVLNTIATAMGSGRVAGMGSAVAVGFGVALWCLGMTLGLAAVFAALPLAQTLLTLVAAGLLGWFASRNLRASWAGLRGAPGLPGAAAGLGFAAGFRRSLLVNVLNPKALTSWLAILTFFPVASASASDIALLCVGASVIATGLHTIYALVFSTPAAARLYLRAGWALSGFAGLFFGVFALRLIAEILASPA
jgi:threonine/homoserine/homoserine lactone efflux protein